MTEDAARAHTAESSLQETRNQLNALTDEIVKVSTFAEAQKNENAKLKQRIRKLEDALRPVIAWHDAIHTVLTRMPDDTIVGGTPETRFTLGDLRRAKETEKE
jgi:seryl-tRNA synthetase